MSKERIARLKEYMPKCLIFYVKNETNEDLSSIFEKIYNDIKKLDFIRKYTVFNLHSLAKYKVNDNYDNNCAFITATFDKKYELRYFEELDDIIKLYSHSLNLDIKYDEGLRLKDL